MNLGRASALVTLSNIGRKVTVFAGLIIFARLLGSAELGTFFLFQSLLILVSVPADFGIRNAIAKRMSEGTDMAKYFTSGFLLKTALILGTSVLLYSLLPYVNRFLGQQFGVLLVLSLVTREISLAFNKALVGQDRVPQAKVIELLGVLCWVLASVFFLGHGLGTVSLIYGLFIKHFFMGSMSLFFTGVIFAVPTREHIRSIYDFGKYAIVTYTSGYIYNWADTILIGAILGPSAVGVYEIAWRVASIFMIVSSSLGASLFPKVSRYHEEQNISAVSDIVEKSLFASIFFIIPGVIGAHLIGDRLLEVFYGAEYVAGATVLTILTFEKLSNSANTVLKFTLNGLDQPELSAISKFTSLFVNILLNIILISLIGIEGAAIATFTAAVVDTVLHHHFLSRKVNYGIEPSPVLWLILSALVMGVLVYIVDQSVVIDTVVTLLAIVFVSSGVYVCISVASRSVRTNISELRDY